MLSKMLRRWWLVVLVVVVAAVVSVARGPRYKGLYTGRATLMAMNGGARAAADLAAVAYGSRVLERSRQAIRDFESLGEPEEILNNTRVLPIEGTSIVKVEVTMRDPGKAKMAADVQAAAIKEVYATIRSPKSAVRIDQDRYIKTVDPASVFPVSTPRSLALIRGLALGLLLGIILAAVLPSKERGIAQQTASSASQG